jgi:hypothetical protein
MNLDHPAIQRCLVADGGDIDSAPLQSIQSVRKPSRAILRTSGMFAIMDNQPSPTRADLLAAKRMHHPSWQLKTTPGPIRLFPFTEIGEETILDLSIESFRRIPGYDARTPPPDSCGRLAHD